MSDYPKPSVAVDLLIVKPRNRVLLIQRKNEPFKDRWALPGGFMNLDETIRDAAVRELEEETGVQLSPALLHFIDIRDEVNRDPRGRVISHAYYAPVPSDTKATAADDAAAVWWCDAFSAYSGNLAFDHCEIIGRAITLGLFKA